MSARNPSFHPLRHPLALAVALALAPLVALPPAHAQSLPQGFNRIKGNVDTPTVNGNTMTINQTSKGAVINWTSFDIGANNTVAFNHAAGADSVTLNRVTAATTASQINGTLSANGRVFVINPYGVLFGSNAAVNVGGLVASTLDIGDDAFMASVANNTKFAFERDPESYSPGNIINDGKITASSGGTVALLGGEKVANNGFIQADGGTIALGWGTALELDIGGDGLTKLIITPDHSGEGIANLSNSGTLRADGGSVILRADRGDGMGVVNQSGIVRARSLQSRGGHIVLDAGDNRLDVSGSQDVRAQDAGVAGGNIALTAQNLITREDALFAAGGGAGGANGQLSITSLVDIQVSTQAQIAIAEPGGSTSYVYDDSLSSALSHGADVSLNTVGATSDGMPVGVGSVFFSQGSNVSKNSGPAAHLVVNSARNIIMDVDAKIASSHEPLDVSFNADATGQGQQAGSTFLSGGMIQLNNASIFTNGGSVAFYGQSDAQAGRATGFSKSSMVSGFISGNSGVLISQSTIDTCASNSASCAGSGSISVRGQGTDSFGLPTLSAGQGIALEGSVLRSGSGDITLLGVGGTGAAGVDIYSAYFDDALPPTQSEIRSTGGTLMIIGASGNEPPTNNLPFWVSSGVEIYDSRFAIGGDIRIGGIGAIRDQSMLADSYFAPSHGVSIYSSELTAGNGRELAIAGKAGSSGLWLGLPGTPDDIPSFGVLLDADSQLNAAAGKINLRTLGNSDVYIQGVLDVSASNGTGGNISVTGNNLLLGSSATLRSDGKTGGGSIEALVDGVLALDDGASISANALDKGNGGRIRLVGNQGIYAYGQLSARGGANGGNGGFIDTSGSGFRLTGLRVDTGASAGNSGSWVLDPYNVSIVHGSGSGSLPKNPFVPLTDAIVQDGDINFALDSGSDVTIGTGTTGQPTDGDIHFDFNVLIERSTGTNPVTFRLDAHRAITGDGFTIRSNAGAGPLNIVFNSDAAGLIGPFGGGIQLRSSTLQSNGGDIQMFGQGDAINGYAGGIDLSATGSGGGPMLIDTRVGGSDTAPAGSVLLRGWGDGDQGNTGTGVTLTGGFNTLDALTINTGTGNIEIVGQGGNGGDGIAMATPNVGAVQLLTSSGGVHLSGFGDSPDPMFGYGSSAGIRSNGNLVTLRTDSGQIDLRGRGAADSQDMSGAPMQHHGILLGNGIHVLSTSGDILLSGSSQGTGLGMGLMSGSLGSNDSVIDAGSGNLIVRAHNNSTGTNATHSLRLNATLRSANVVNIRGGSVDANGNVVENPGDPITIGAADSYQGGVNLDADLSRIEASTLVLGSAQQTGDISVSYEAGDVDYTGNLTLHAGAGGNILLDGGILDVGTHTLALIAGGNISQGMSFSAIVAGSLLANATNGNVSLNNFDNKVAAQTVAGSAAGSFMFTNNGDVGIGTVNATGFNSSNNTATALTASGIDAGGDVFVQSVNGDVLLNGNVGGNAIQLVTGPTGVFLNPSGSAITATNYWRVWASTWVGENRNGVVGNGALPNLYGCAFSATCNVTPTATNQFIYAAQPTAIVTTANATRVYGQANGPLSHTVTGMILGDQAANAIAGNASSTAGPSSNVGSYSILGNFTSPAGYFLQIMPGALAVTPATLTYTANPYSRLYGGLTTSLTGSVDGFLLSDTLATATTGALSFTTSATQSSNVGNYAINGGGLSATNYVFVQAPGNANAFAITPATLTYTANPYSRVYGAPNGSLTGTLSGFVLNDTQASATTGTMAFTTAATPSSNVGGYAINGGGLDAINYVFAQSPGNANAFTITPAMLTYTADPYTRTYGAAAGPLTGTVDGFVLGDTLATATTGTLTFTGLVEAISGVGTYGIHGGGLSATNYIFTQAIDNAYAYAITPATLTYTANPFSRLYGDITTSLNGTVDGFVLGETLASATRGTLFFNTSATPASNVGTYAINGSGLSADNYVFVQAAGNASAFAITPATLTYTANPYSRVYGAANGSLTGTLSGFVLGDTQASATSGTLTFNTPATQTTNVGNHAINGGGLTALNYIFAQAPGNATAYNITPAILTYVAKPTRWTAGLPGGTLGGTVTGFVNGETLAGTTTGTLSFESHANIHSPVGTYGIFGTGLNAQNYTFVQATGNAVALTIAPPPQTYTLDIVRDMPLTYVYDRNFGIVAMCPATDLASGSRDQDGDTLAREWSRVRSRPNLANCVSTRQKNTCGDF